MTSYGSLLRNLSADAKSIEDVNFLAKAELGLFLVLTAGPPLGTEAVIAFNTMKFRSFFGIRLAKFFG
jgi:hypothetical protein